MMKIADSLRLFALFGHSTRENGGASQAVRTPMRKIAETLRLFAFFAHTAHEHCGTSQVACMRLMKSPRVSGCLHFLCTPFRTWRDVSGGLHPHDENCRDFQVFCNRGHENGGASQAVCMPMMKIAERLRLFALLGHSTRENGGAS